jgi:cytochrome P450
MVKVHKGKNLLGVSFGFIDNAAVFTAEEGIVLGDFYRLTLPFHTIYVTTSPEIIQKAFVGNDANYRKSKIYWQQLRALTGDSIGTLEGKAWTELRSFENHFYKPTYVQRYLNTIETIINKHIESWKRNAPAQNEYPVSMLLSQLNIEIILKSVFGFYDTCSFNDLVHAIEDGENLIAWRSKYPWRPYTGWLTGENWKGQKDLAFFDAFVRRILPAAKPDYLAKKLYHALPDTLSEKDKIKRVRNELIVHLGAGTETAAVSLTWALYLLVKHPEVLEKVNKEVDSLTEVVTIHTILHKLPYLKQVTEESLRLYPPSHAIVRDCADKDTLAGQEIKEGDTIYASVYGIHRNPRLWPQPEVFDPERFSEENKKLIPDYAYIPFGVGKHTCIGRYLTMPVLMITLYKILKNFSIASTIHPNLKPLSLSTLKPDKEVRIKLIPR